MKKKAEILLFIFIIILFTSIAHAQNDITVTSCTLDKTTSASTFYNGLTAWSPDGKLVAAVYKEGHLTTGVHIMDPQSMEIMNDIRETPEPITPNLLVWSPDGSAIAISAGRPYEIVIWTTSNIRQTINLQDDTEIVTQITWSLDGRELAVVSHEIPPLGQHEFRPGYIVRVWDVETGQLLEQSADNLDQAFAIATENGWEIVAGIMDDTIIQVITLDGTPISGSFPATDLVDFVITEERTLVVGFMLNEADASQSTLTVWDVTLNQPLIILEGETGLLGSNLQAEIYLVATITSLDQTVYRLPDGEAILSDQNTRFFISPSNTHVIASEFGLGGSATHVPTISVSLLDFGSDDTLATLPPAEAQGSTIRWSPMGDAFTSGDISNSDFVWEQAINVWRLVDCG